MDLANTIFPKAFISYSQDSQQHKAWVLNLATRLRNNGVDALLDLWDVKAGSDLPAFMEIGLASADHILLICTENYVKKANAGIGGVGYEKMIITSALMNRIDPSKIIPIVRHKGSGNVPTFVKTKMYLDFSVEDNFEEPMDELLRTIHQAPLFEKPPIGINPFLKTPIGGITPVNDSLKLIMQQVGQAYERNKGKRGLSTFQLSVRLGTSIMATEVIVQQIVDQQYLAQILLTDGIEERDSFLPTEKGMHYILENKLL